MNETREAFEQSASWVLVDRRTGKAVSELFNRDSLRKINQDQFEVVAIADWLSIVNFFAR